MGVEYIGNGKPDGVCLGQSASEKIAFHNATPVIQQTAATALVTVAASTGSGIYGFDTPTQADDIATQVNVIRAVLNTYGLTA